MVGTGSNPGERRGGRKKGIPNKRNQEVAEKIAALGCDPFAGMIEVARLALEGVVVGMDDQGKPILKQDLAVAGQMYKELAQYMAPKRKAIEHTGANGEELKSQPTTIIFKGE